MPRHPDSRHRRAVYGGTGTELRERPVDRNGHCRGFITIDKRAANPSSDGGFAFKGHAAVFDQRTLIGSKTWGFYEEIAPGAFSKTIKEADVRFLFNHDPSMILARTSSGTCNLAEDDIGLDVRADVGPYPWAAGVSVGLGRGDLKEMSFAFDPIKWERSEDADGVPIYRLLEVRLWDVAIVTYPAYEGTDAELDDSSIEEAAQRLHDALKSGTLQRSDIERLLSWTPATVTGDSEPGSSTRNDDVSPVSTSGVEPEETRTHDDLRHRLLAELLS